MAGKGKRDSLPLHIELHGALLDTPSYLELCRAMSWRTFKSFNTITKHSHINTRVKNSNCMNSVYGKSPEILNTLFPTFVA